MSILERNSHWNGEAVPWPNETTRRAEWLLSSYGESVWSVRDSHGGSDTVTLSLMMRMPDGRCVTEWLEFYKATKEFAFFIRSGHYAKINDAETHTAYVYALMDVVHGLALDGFTSFKHVSSSLLNGDFLKRIEQGTDSLLRASERVSNWLASRDVAKRSGFQDGLPLRQRRGGGVLRMLDSGRLMEMIGLPDSACKLPRVAHLCNEASRLAGIQTQAKPRKVCPPHQTLTSSALYRYLNALDMLYEMRSEVEAVSLPDRPFVNPSNLALRKGVEPTPTPIPPPALALHLLSQAMLWVTNYSEELIGLLRRAGAARTTNWTDRRSRTSDFAVLVEQLPKDGPEGCPWPLLPQARARMSGRLACESAVRHLFTACVIVIAAFSARRRDELAALEEGDLAGSDIDGWWLKPYIEKTLQRKDWIPVPKVVARAFEVLLALSAVARRKSATDFVFQWWNPFETSPNLIESVVQDTDAIDAFAAWVKTPNWEKKGEVPRPWHWALHQFRKFFAVLYFYRYRGATIEVLANFLRHFNLEMTRRYLLRSKDLKEIFESVEWNYTLDVSRAIVAKGAAVQGGMGKTLAKQLADRLRPSLRVTAAALEDPEEYIARQVKSHRLVITPKAWADCACPRTIEAGKAARCRSDELLEHREPGPNFEKAGPAVCAACPFSIDNGRLAETLAEEALRVRRAFSSKLLEGSILEGVARQRLATAFVYQPK